MKTPALPPYKPAALAVAALLASFAAAPASAAQTPPAANALPTGGQVVAGQAGIAQSGNALTVTQGSQRAVIDWQTFNIGSQASVNFVQPSASAVTLNRVLAGEASQIYGSLTANGQVYLVNPAGIVFGAGSRVDVGGLVASTLNITNDDFLAGRAVFSRNGATGAIVNRGSIAAKDGGLVALLAPTVQNEGVISARLGNVALAAGNRITLDAGADGRLQLAVDPATVKTLVENRQLIVADGGQVLMTAKAADALAGSVVANSGTIQARTVAEKDGRILLLADMAHGEVRLDGKLDASAPDGGNGGFVETSAAHVRVADGARVTTLAAAGRNGTWLIDPNDYTIAASGGDISGTALSANLASGNVTIQSANGGTAGNGDIFVNDAVSWSANTTLSLQAVRDIAINADITATGNTAGLILGYGAGRDYYVNAPITLSGSAPLLKIGVGGAESTYTVINSLGVAGDASTTTLQGMKNNHSGKYALGSDIDASATAGWNAGAGFYPVAGEYQSAFGGIFAGLGHTVSNLTINHPTAEAFGLFGQVNGATIRDVGLVGGSVSGSEVNLHSGVGGLVGILWSGTVKNSFNTGSVSGPEMAVGGLVGLNGGTVSNSYATGNVSNIGEVGGLVGENQGTIINSYSTGAVTGGWLVGGLVGLDCGGGNTNSYWNTQTSGQASSPGGTGKTTAEMKQMATFAGWDFTNTWRIYEGQSYPVLRAFQRDLTVAANNAGKTYDGNAYAGGNGAAYSIASATPSGTLSYGGTAQGAVNAGSYSIVPGGLVSDQRYHIGYANGTLTISPAPGAPPAAAPQSAPADGNRPGAAGLARTQAVLPALSLPDMHIADSGSFAHLELRPGFIALPGGGTQ